MAPSGTVLGTTSSKLRYGERRMGTEYLSPAGESSEGFLTAIVQENTGTGSYLT